VPFIVVDEDRRPLRPGGSLQDIAPTILGMLNVSQPREMTGRDLRVK
jgi:2,3-bisphosphoglycerate-independent phosphoglycerate mutase